MEEAYFFNPTTFWCSAYVIEHRGHLLQIEINYCKDNHTTDVNLHKVKLFFCILLDICHINTVYNLRYCIMSRSDVLYSCIWFLRFIALSTYEPKQNLKMGVFWVVAI
jgi:hypothetical protein